MTTLMSRPTAGERSPLREVARFAGLAFLGAWLVGGLGYVVLDLGEFGLGIGVLMVAVAALVCTRRDEGSVRPMIRQIVRWRLGARWYAAALVVPFAAVAAALFASAATGRGGLAADAPGVGFLLMLPVFVLFFGGPEELGWRGYVLPRLQARFTALGATLLLSGIWMAWHIPVLLAPGVIFAEMPAVPYLVIGVTSSVVYTWLYNSTGGSILIVIILHGATNLSLAWIATAHYPLLAGAWTLAAVAIIAIYGPRDLSRRARHVSSTARHTMP